MIDFDTFCRLRLLHDEKGLKTAQIAEALHLDPKTVEKWIDRPTYQQRQGRKAPSKLDSFRGLIAAQLERHPYSTQQLFQQLRQQGYTGGYSILKDFVRQIRPVNKPAYLALAFAPGECAQVDWGSVGSVSVGSTRRRLSFFVMVLCHSRMMYVEFTLSEGMEQFLSCHRHAFEFLGGVPQKVMIDQYHPVKPSGIRCKTLSMSGMERRNRVIDSDFILRFSPAVSMPNSLHAHRKTDFFPNHRMDSSRAISSLRPTLRGKL